MVSSLELQGLEPIFHRLPPGAGRQEIEALVEPDFFEVGASGSLYARTFVIDTVERRYLDGVDPRDDSWSVSDFASQTLAPDLALVTYLLQFDGRMTRRSTIWRWNGSRWAASYHQGTPCADSAPLGDGVAGRR